MTKFITVAGKKQTGKDTSAQLIQSLLPDKKVKIVHFADALKTACSAIFGIPLVDMETEEGKQKLIDVRWPEDEALYSGTGWRPDPNGRYMTVREVLQFTGTELFRNQMDPDIWARSAFRQDYSDYDIVVVADCRFPNECRIGKKHGLLIKVERETGLPSDGHISENALDDFNDYDAVLKNNSKISALKHKWQNILMEHNIV